jgi:tetratricopeptide (TPR) repeat protein
MSRYRIFSALLTAGAIFFASPAVADELQEINKLVKQGQNTAALERLNGYLNSHPKDAQARFLKGLILTEQNKPSDAIAVFTALTQDYPELPEPYNNLAVLYASQQQYEKARIALEMAIRTHPSYATAHENLGDIYAKMASLSYDKALQIDKGNTSAQTKLSMIRDLFSPAAGAKAPPTKTEPAKQASAPAPVALPAPPKPVAPAVSAPLPQPVAKVAAAEPLPVKEHKESKPIQGDQNAVLESVNSWAQAWSKKDVKAYIASYTRDFKAPGGNRADWEKSRKERISHQKSIQVAIVAPKVTIDGERAIVNFKQIYRSDSLKTSTHKTLVMVKTGNKWLIQEEQVGH